MRVVWAESADQDLDAIVYYIARDSVQSALRIQDRIEGAVGRLGSMAGRTPLGRLSNTRELVVTGTPYLVVIEIDVDVVNVVRVLHGAQQWPPREP